MLIWDEGSQASLQRGPLPLVACPTNSFLRLGYYYFCSFVGLVFVPFKALLQRWM